MATILMNKAEFVPNSGGKSASMTYCQEVHLEPAFICFVKPLWLKKEIILSGVFLHMLEHRNMIISSRIFNSITSYGV